MEKATCLVGAWSLLAFASIAAQPAGPGGDIRKAIEEENKRFMAMFEKRDAKGVAELYTDDGMLLPPGSPTVYGREQIEKFWKTGMDSGVSKVALETLEVEGFGDTAFERGKYALWNKEAKELAKGHYLVIWKQIAGKWKLHRDTWNSAALEK